jgi:hypothetical protein
MGRSKSNPACTRHWMMAFKKQLFPVLRRPRWPTLLDEGGTEAVETVFFGIDDIAVSKVKHVLGSDDV